VRSSSQAAEPRSSRTFIATDPLERTVGERSLYGVVMIGNGDSTVISRRLPRAVEEAA
jgi:hypothetical protein